jgi:hypothetical protein
VRKILILLVTHALVGVVGFVAGIYALPILTAPPSPSEADVRAVTTAALYSGQFRRNLKGSDVLHWGEGTVSISRNAVALQGRVAPGPDYKLYLSPEFVETKADFMRLKPRMVRVGDVVTFENFMVSLPTAIDPSAYNTVIVWCEAFSMFITSANYR